MLRSLSLPGFTLFLLLLNLSAVLHAGGSTPPIDRHALVTRHNIAWNDPAGQIPLGNGEFCFNADGTGLQTFGGNTMAHWGWHSFPLPAGWTPDRVPSTGTFQQVRSQGPDIFPPGTETIRQWMYDNPHTLNLARLQLRRADGSAVKLTEITGLQRSYDLWAGVQTSTYRVDGQMVKVETLVHPQFDAVVVRIASPLIASGALHVTIDFPYPSIENSVWVGDFGRDRAHTTEVVRRGQSRADIRRIIDGTTYHVGLDWAEGAEMSVPEGAPHQINLSARRSDRLEFICAFSPEAIDPALPTFAQAVAATADHWQKFWSTGGAIDLSGSKDPRWFELERRIVLSQYELAAQSAGSFPSAEDGLMGIYHWRGQFHMEMVWWHLAHYALWDRWAMAEPALKCYERFVPAARALATQLGYKGLKWPKSVGPEGRSAPWTGNQVLLWKQPHPIFFAELDYRLHPTRATLEKWADIVAGTAEHMADYATRDPVTGVYSLTPDMEPSEHGITSNSVFDLAYWRWGLDQAQIWQQRLGRARNPHWDDVRQHLAPLPVADGVYLDSAEWPDAYTKQAWGHPDMLGVFGMLPPIAGMDRATAHRSALKVWQSWDWANTWGWDFPWMAMAAARNGEPQLAIEALLKDTARNRYDQRGVNTGALCPYLPGNGGLLYAVAMMAAGWDQGPSGHAPGFPADGSWNVKWEDLKPAL